MKIFKVFAVEPSALNSWEQFRYVTEKFGFSKGMVMSRIPKTWERRLINNLNVSEIERLKIVTKLQHYKFDRMVSSGCNYDDQFEWIQNVKACNYDDKFEEIIVSEDTRIEGDSGLHSPESIDEEFFDPITEVRVRAKAEKLCEPAHIFLTNSTEVVFVDPYFQVYRKKCMGVLNEFLIKACIVGKCKRFLIISSYEKSHPKGGQKDVDRYCESFFDKKNILPDVQIVFRYIAENSATEKLHARYFLCQKGGLRYDKGFQEESEDVLVDVSLLDKNLAEEVSDLYSFSSNSLNVVEEYPWGL